MAEDADLILYVVDSSLPLDENDEEIMEMLSGKKSIVIYNKTDLQPEPALKILKEKTGSRSFLISAVEETGITELEDEIRGMFFQENFPLMMRYILQMPVIKQHLKRRKKV